MKFTKWQRFDKVNLASVSEQKGIYAFAISSKPISDFVITEKAIVYFGMTNAKGGLRSRLRQFQRTLFDGKDAHGGALRFRFAHNADLENLKKKLYFSVCEYKSAAPNDSYADELVLMGEVAKAEYVAFAKYFEKYGRLPKYNDKKLSPKK